MSLIFQGATLIITAADSEDSTKRLCKAERPEVATLRVPYHTQEGSTRGSYNIAGSMSCEWKEPLDRTLDGPLRERGWVFQEWYLGRRKVFFTSKGIIWSCAESAMNERGKSLDWGLYESASGLSCLEEYSPKYLTYASDRVIALLGVTTELAKSRKDSFVSEYGMWEDQAAEQLLWRALEARGIDEDLPDLPSWSWAATGGSKIWMDHDDLQQAIVNGSAQIFKVKGSGSRNASGALFAAKVAPIPLRQCCIENYENERRRLRPGSTDGLEQRKLPDWQYEYYEIRRCPILNQNGAREPLGLAIFDDWAYSDEFFFFILASSRRSSDDPWYSTNPFH